jgi:tRNA dimethylallyltransferase
MTLDAARDAAVTASRQYAKRQRTWFRSKHQDWHKLDMSHTGGFSALAFVP